MGTRGGGDVQAFFYLLQPPRGCKGMSRCDANNYVLKVRLTAIKEGGKKTRRIKKIFMILLSEMIFSKVSFLFSNQ